jgi:hypothetical protein
MKLSFEIESDDYLQSLDVRDEAGQLLCHIQQAVGHCCGATILSRVKSEFWRRSENVEKFLRYFSPAKKLQAGLYDYVKVFGLTHWPVQGFYVYLSVQTAYYDVGIRNSPYAKYLHTFINYASSGMGTEVSLYYLELPE